MLFKKLDKSSISLLANYSLHFIVNIYINTFLVAYILNISLGNFYNVALYYLISYITMLFSYFIVTIIASKVNKTLILQISSFMYIPILIAIAILDSNIVNHLIIMAIVIKIVEAFYYASHNALTNEKVRGSQLKKFNTYLKVLSFIVSVIFPVIFGTIIDSKDIQVVAIFVIVICALLFISTLFIDKSSLTHNKLDFKGYYQNCINSNHKRAFSLIFLGEFLYGLKDGLTVLVTMLVVLTFKTNTSLGLITSIISLISVILLLISNHISNKNLNKLTLPITGVVILSIILLIIDVTKINVVIFNFTISSLLLIINQSFCVMRSGIIRAVDRKEYILEHQVFCEIGLDLGRIVFYTILISVSFSQDILIYKLLLAIGIVLISLYGTIGYLTNKEYDKILIEKAFLRNNSTPDYLIKEEENKEIKIGQIED